MSFPPHDSEYANLIDRDALLIFLSLRSIQLPKGRGEGYCILERDRRVSDQFEVIGRET